jgi:uncharacterized protein YodC (DUF2158 family)
MPAETFKMTDLVYQPQLPLGPKMLFDGYEQPGLAKCHWFVGHELKTGTFPAEQLELVPAKPPEIRHLRRSSRPTSYTPFG